MGPTVHTHTHTFVVESFGTYSEGDVCVCGSAGNGTLTYYTTPRTNPLTTVDTLVTPSTAEHTRTVYTALKTDDHPRSLHTRVSTCLPASYSLSLRAHTHPHSHIHTHKLTHSFFFLLPTADHLLSSMPLTLVPFILLRESHLPFYFVTLVILYIHYDFTIIFVGVLYTIVALYTQYTILCLYA